MAVYDMWDPANPSKSKQLVHAMLSVLLHKCAAETPSWRGLGNTYCLTHDGECGRESVLYKRG